MTRVCLFLTRYCVVLNNIQQQQQQQQQQQESVCKGTRCHHDQGSTQVEHWLSTTPSIQYRCRFAWPCSYWCVSVLVVVLISAPCLLHRLELVQDQPDIDSRPISTGSAGNRTTKVQTQRIQCSAIQTPKETTQGN
jgi:hypothetical protein